MSDEATSAPPPGNRLAAVVPTLKAWVGSLAVSRKDLTGDAVAGVPGAVGSVPDGMAASVLVGVNPVHGLYASFAGPIFGGLTSNTRLMVITTTSAAALAAGSALQSFNPAEREQALIILTLLAGVLMVAAGIFRLGRYTRFVSLSVMLGFLTGVAANIVLSQIGDFTGAKGSGGVALTRAIDIHPASRARSGGIGAGRQRDAGPARRAHEDAHRRLRLRHRPRCAQHARPGAARRGHGRGRRRDTDGHPAGPLCRRCTCCSRPTS